MTWETDGKGDGVEFWKRDILIFKNMEIQGKVIAVLEARNGISRQGNEWMTQDYVIETEDKYPKRMCFSLFGENKIKESDIKMGENIKVSFDIDAREWNGRWFNSILAWKIERATQQTQTVQQMQPLKTSSRQSASNNDLPF